MSEEQLEHQEYDERTLEDHLVDQLMSPEHAMELYKHHFREEWLTFNEVDERIEKDKELVALLNLMDWVFDYIEEYGEAPTPERIFEANFEVPFDPPARPTADLVLQFQERYQIAELEKYVLRVGRLTRTDPAAAIEVGLEALNRVRLETADTYREFGNQDLLLAYDEAQARKEDREGITTGFEEIDWHLNGGFKAPMFSVIVGRLGTYKSWFMLKSAVSAMLAGKRVIFYPLEMGEEEMIERETAMLLEKSWHGWQHNAFDKDELRDQVLALKEDFADHGGDLIWHTPDEDQFNMRSLLTIAKERNADAIYIDQLEDMEPSDPSKRGEPDWLKFEYIVKEAKMAAKVERIPIIIAHQFNRDTMSKDVKCLADLSDKVARSDAIMKRADLSLAIWRNKALESADLLQFGIIKSRQHEKMGWEMKVALNANSNIRLVDEISKDAYYGQD